MGSSTTKHQSGASARQRSASLDEESLLATAGGTKRADLPKPVYEPSTAGEPPLRPKNMPHVGLDFASAKKKGAGFTEAPDSPDENPGDSTPLSKERAPASADIPKDAGGAAGSEEARKPSKTLLGSTGGSVMSVDPANMTAIPTGSPTAGAAAAVYGSSPQDLGSLVTPPDLGTIPELDASAAGVSLEASTEPGGGQSGASAAGGSAAPAVGTAPPGGPAAACRLPGEDHSSTAEQSTALVHGGSPQHAPAETRLVLTTTSSSPSQHPPHGSPGGSTPGGGSSPMPHGSPASRTASTVRRKLDGTAGFVPGDRLVIGGLVDQPEYNGSFCVVVGVQSDAAQTCEVVTTKGGDHLMVQSQNLVHLKDPRAFFAEFEGRSPRSRAQMLKQALAREAIDLRCCCVPPTVLCKFFTSILPVLGGGTMQTSQSRPSWDCTGG